MIEIVIGIAINISAGGLIYQIYNLFKTRKNISSNETSDDEMDIYLDDLIFDEDEMDDGKINGVSENKNLKVALSEKKPPLISQDELMESDLELLNNYSEFNDLIMFHYDKINENDEENVEGIGIETNCNTNMTVIQEEKLEPSKENRDNLDNEEMSVSYKSFKNYSIYSKSSKCSIDKSLTVSDFFNLNNSNEDVIKLLSQKRKKENTHKLYNKENQLVAEGDSLKNIKLKKRIKKIKKNSYSPKALSEKNNLKEPFLQISSGLGSGISSPTLSNNSSHSHILNDDNKISIVTYNILNQIYMKRANRDDLNIQNRMTKIIKELLELNSDVICLQEADLNTYRSYILNSLPEYNFIYGVNCGSSFINIIGFKKTKYRFISFKNFSLLEIKVIGNRGAMNVVLEKINDRDQISIYNLHLPWRHEQQRCQILEKIFNHTLENKISNVILAGDFNSEPYSLPVKLILFEKYFNDLKWEKENNFLNEMGGIRGSVSQLISEHQFNFFEIIKENFRFESAYENYQLYLKINKMKKNILNTNTANNHPMLTSCTEYFKNTIDYIFHSKSFELLKILRLPDSYEIFEEGFLPSAKFPSDHLKLYAEYKLL